MIGRETERVSEIKFRFVILVDRLINQPRKEIKHLFRRRIRADVIIFARQHERFADLLNHFKASGAFEFDALHADVGAAEIERKKFAGLFARRQAHVRFEHAQRRILRIVESELEVLTEIRCHFAKMFAVDGKFVDERLQLLSVQCHFCISLSV